jgi:glycosyltransferase involved in cell wall biosynthesis
VKAKVAAAIPAYQAAASVGDVVRRTARVLPHVLVVDDGSSDGTADAARVAGARVIRIGENRGKGHALRVAFEALFDEGHDAVVTLDADGQHLPEEIGKLTEAWAETQASLVLGSRAHLFARMCGVRRHSNRLSSRAILLGLDTDIGDVQTGFRLYTRELIATTGFPEPRFEAESAVVCRALRLGLPVATVGIALGVVDGRGTSHYRPVIDSLRIARAVVRARLESLDTGVPA